MIETMTVAEVAKLLECEEKTVIDKAGAGKLAAVRYGRSWVFLRAALMEGLHRTALENLNPKTAPPPRQTPEPMGYALTVPPSKRTAANKSRQRPCPDLPPVEAWSKSAVKG